MPETWYLRSAAGEDCGPGDHESLSESQGAVFQQKLFIGGGHTWNYRESASRRVDAGDWYIIFDVQSAGSGSVNVKVQRRSAGCAVEQSIVDEDVAVPGSGLYELLTTLVDPGETIFAEGEILIAIFTYVDVMLYLRYNADFVEADSRLVRPESFPYVPPQVARGRVKFGRPPDWSVAEHGLIQPRFRDEDGLLK